MKKFFRWLLGGLGILFILSLLLFFIFDEKLPEGTEGPEAEKVADKVLAYINHDSWKETAVIEWTFADIHHYVWDKTRHLTEVKWGSNRVLLNINDQSGVVFENGEQVSDSSKVEELLKTAYQYWANDSFWLNPLSKIRDFGTKRSLVSLEDRNYQGLLVTYTSGGVTPGDSYLWWVDKETGRVDAVEMWVNIIPIGGVKFSWEDWMETSQGTKIAQYHEGLLDLRISNIKAYANYNDFSEKDLFKDLNFKSL